MYLNFRVILLSKGELTVEDAVQKVKWGCREFTSQQLQEPIIPQAGWGEYGGSREDVGAPARNTVLAYMRQPFDLDAVLSNMHCTYALIRHCLLTNEQMIRAVVHLHTYQDTIIYGNLLTNERIFPPRKERIAQAVVDGRIKDVRSLNYIISHPDTFSRALIDDAYQLLQEVSPWLS